MLVPGLRNTIALDFHLSKSTLYWTDVVEDKIYRGKLSENGGEAARLSVLVEAQKTDENEGLIYNLQVHLSLSPFCK